MSNEAGFACCIGLIDLVVVSTQTVVLRSIVAMVGYMYILECVDGSYYTGSTKDLGRRFLQHQSGVGARHTAKRLPVKLVYCERFDHVAQAFYREKQVQGWSRKKKAALIRGDKKQLKHLASKGSADLGVDVD